MESKSRNLGSSLKVACVHELASQNLSSVPNRYVRSDINDPHTLLLINAKEIPVIDLQKLLSLSEGEDLMNLELEKLHLACKDWGFFQIVNHGINSTIIEKVKKEVEAFFHLPKEVKENMGQAADDLEGFGQAFVVSEEQKLDWADMFYLVTQPSCLRNPYLFPKLAISFREAIEMYSVEVNSLAVKIFKLMARALKMEVEDMNVLFEGGMQSMRMNHYPPCPQPELVMGFCPHSDSVGITILLQVSEVEGLQIRKDGVWIPVIPLPHAFIVNVGDMLEILTNGIYKSVEHRATVNSDKERISIAAFHIAKMEGDLVPASSLVTPQHPPKFKRISVLDYTKGYLSRELDGKSYLDTMRV